MTINDLGVGPEEIEREKNSEALLQGKNFKRQSRGKNKFIFNFSTAPPQIINSRPLKFGV